MAQREPTLSELVDIAILDLDQSINRPNILRYGEKPYPEQERFHHSDALGRFLSGGNRGGKTTSEVVECIWWATDTHPWLTRPKEWGYGPLKLRFVVSDVAKGVNQIILPELKRWLPQSYLIDGSWSKSWDAINLILTLKNGSTIDFVTWGMELAKLGGVARHIIFFDERPPQAVFNECTVRLIDYGGRWVIAATILEGDVDWTYELLWEPAQREDTIQHRHIDTFTLRARDNPYNQSDDEQRSFYALGMSEAEKEIRESGEWSSRTGLVFPKIRSDPDYIQLPSVTPKFLDAIRRWEWYTSVDFGWRHPTVWLWHAVGPQGQIVTFGEHFASGMTVPQHVEAIRDKERSFGRMPNTRVGDPAGQQRVGTTGTSYVTEYATRGIGIATEGVPHDVMIGVEKMQQYFWPSTNSPWLTDEEIEQGAAKPTWMVTGDCPNFLRELQRVRWKSYESAKRNFEEAPRQEIHKQNDDAFDSARYFATLMPDLTPTGGSFTKRDSVPETISYGDMLARLRDDPDVEFAEDRDGYGVVQEYEDYFG